MFEPIFIIKNFQNLPYFLSRKMLKALIFILSQRSIRIKLIKRFEEVANSGGVVEQNFWRL